MTDKIRDKRSDEEFEHRSYLHQFILQQIHSMYRAKNKDYGGSFTKLFKEYGLISPIIKLEDKLSRLKNLSKNPDSQQVLSESIEDTLLDLANYAIMTVLELRNLNCDSVDFENFDYSVLPKIVAVDFDGTLVTGEEFPKIGLVNNCIVSELVHGRYKDYKKILLTSRSGSVLAKALNFLDEFVPELKFDAVNDNIEEVKSLIGGPYPKIWYDVLIDDKAVNLSYFDEKE